MKVFCPLWSIMEGKVVLCKDACAFRLTKSEINIMTFSDDKLSGCVIRDFLKIKVWNALLED